MKVYRFDAGRRRLVGRTDLPEDAGPVYEAALSGAASVIAERFIIGLVALRPPGGGAPVEERAVLLSPWQSPQLLPGWEPLAS
jgi:hypothetical protein